MRSTTTLILFAIATALGIWIYLGESSQNSKLDNQESNTLTVFQPEILKEIVIKSDGVETVIRKQDDLWFFEKPVADRASQAATAAVLDLLTHLTIRDHISAEEINSDSKLSEDKLGFSDEDVIEITLIPDANLAKNKSAKTVSLSFGKLAPMANTIYARIEGDHKKAGSVYVVEGNPRKYFDDPAAALRDQTLIFAPLDSLTGLTIRTPDSTIKLERKINSTSAEWIMLKPIPARANAELIEMLLAQLSSLHVENLLNTNTATIANPNPVPENSAVFELQLAGVTGTASLSIFLTPNESAESDAPTTLKNSTDPNKNSPPLLEARTSDRPATFLVRSSLLEQLPSSADAFRDPHLARIPVQMLHSIIIQTRDNPNVILTAMPPSSTGQIQWKSDRNGKRESANLAKIISLVSAVNKEKIIKFIDSKSDPSAYGIDHPFTAITFNIFQPATPTPDGSAPDPATSTMQTPETIQRTLKLGHSKDDANHLFAKFVDEPYIYQISPSFSNRVSPHPLKWKDPKVLSFSMLSLRRIEVQKRDQPPLQLAYDYTQDIWSGEEAGIDIKERIDRKVALKLASTLGSLTAEDWITTSQLAYQALNQPSLALNLVVEEIDRALQEPTEVTHTIKFAPASTTGFYYGSLDSSPDVFIINRETYRALVRPVLVAPVDTRPIQ